MCIKHGVPVFSQRDLYSLDYQLKDILCHALKRLREASEHREGVPMSVLPDLPVGVYSHSEEQLEEGHKKYLEVLDKMIYAFDRLTEPQMDDYNFDFRWKHYDGRRIGFECTDVEEFKRYKDDLSDWQEKCLEGRLLFAEHFDSLYL